MYIQGGSNMLTGAVSLVSGFLTLVQGYSVRVITCILVKIVQYLCNRSVPFTCMYVYLSLC